MSKLQHVSSADFETEVLQSELPVLVDFMADWCPPCRAIGPVLEGVATQFAGKAKILKLNVDDNPDIELRYGVKSIPTLILFQGGQVVDTIIGLVPRSRIAKAFEPYLPG